MSNKDILVENGYEDVIVFENPSFEGALIGVDTDMRAVYSYEKMIESLMKEDNITYEEAE